MNRGLAFSSKGVGVGINTSFPNFPCKNKMCSHMCVCPCMCVYVCVSVHVYLYRCVHVCLVCVCVCVCVCEQLCIFSPTTESISFSVSWTEAETLTCHHNIQWRMYIQTCPAFNTSGRFTSHSCCGTLRKTVASLGPISLYTKQDHCWRWWWNPLAYCILWGCKSPDSPISYFFSEEFTVMATSQHTCGLMIQSPQNPTDTSLF